MNEANMQVFFRDYLKKNPPSKSETYELKFSKQDSFPFERIKEHQIDALLTSKKGLFHKITDQPWGYNPKYRFQRKKPFDCLFIKDVEGYLIIWFYRPRKPKRFIKVAVRDFIKFWDDHPRQSFHEDEISKIATEILNI